MDRGRECEVQILTRTAHRLFSRPFLPFLVVEGIAVVTKHGFAHMPRAMFTEYF